ncbi:SDR family NAD(P)-dependent oxidoreductase [Phaeobacter sp.]|uniref:SDR family NAD(P)-dependent oxidoreductase n=1 Tax=Phaeobacter sp. TaxID=1902409 RepID=UPI0025E24B97|nr:SDR family NAD(P)-dependent oxidoreductase [Phaeobacter sp.]
MTRNTPKHVVIFGASGGIGQALVAHYASQPGIESLHAVARRALPARAGITNHQADITNPHQIEALAGQLKSQKISPDLVILATGLLSDDAGLRPEKSYRQQSMEAFEQVFATNTFGPAMVARHFLGLMPRKERAVFAALSARVGSISDNGLGGWHAYRASKTALNMLLRNYAIEMGRTHEQMICVGLHPGTVRTELSNPFSGNVAPDKLFEPDQAAAYLTDVIDGLTPDQSGKVFDWAGREIPA